MLQNKTNGIIVQARTGSTRMPLKMVKNFYKDQSLLAILLERFKSIIKNELLIVATTQNPADDVICETCTRLNVPYYRGEEADVLHRFISTCHVNNIANIIRVCADNPFLDLVTSLELMEILQRAKCDYVGYSIERNRPSIKSHLGLFGEAVSVNALERAAALCNEAIYHEHVTNYIYEHPDLFNIKLIEAPFNLFGRSDLRFTLDTTEDFYLHQKIYHEMISRYGQSYTIDQLIRHSEMDPSIMAVMKEQIIKNSK